MIDKIISKTAAVPNVDFTTIQAYETWLETNLPTDEVFAEIIDSPKGQTYSESPIFSLSKTDRLVDYGFGSKEPVITDMPIIDGQLQFVGVSRHYYYTIQGLRWITANSDFLHVSAYAGAGYFRFVGNYFGALLKRLYFQQAGGIGVFLGNVFAEGCGDVNTYNIRGNMTLYLLYNTFYKANRVFLDANNRNKYLYGNIFFIPAGVTQFHQAAAISSSRWFSDFNCWHREDLTALCFNNGGTIYSDLTDLQAWGKDASSLSTNPNLVAPGSDDFRLGASSPNLYKEGYAGRIPIWNPGWWIDLPNIGNVDLEKKRYDAIKSSFGCIQFDDQSTPDASPLTPDPGIMLYPDASPITDTTPDVAMLVGNLNTPHSPFGTAQFIAALFRQDTYCQLNGAIDDSQTSITVDTVNGSFGTSGWLLIDGEIIQYTNFTGTVFTVVRGNNNSRRTLNVAHLDNTFVYKIENIWASDGTHPDYAALGWAVNDDGSYPGSGSPAVGSWTALGTTTPARSAAQPGAGVSIDPDTTDETVNGDLNAGIAAGDTTIVLKNVAGTFPASGGYVKIRGEIIRYGSFTGSGPTYNLNNCIRGMFGTTAQAFLVDEPVELEEPRFVKATLPTLALNIPFFVAMIEDNGANSI